MTLIQHNFKSPTPTLVLLSVILLTPTSVMSPSAEASSKPCSSYGVKATYGPSAVSLCHSLLASSLPPGKEPLVFWVSVLPLYGFNPSGTKTMLFKAWVGWGCAQLIECLPSTHEDLSLILKPHMLCMLMHACNPSTQEVEWSRSSWSSMTTKSTGCQSDIHETPTHTHTPLPNMCRFFPLFIHK